MGEHLVSTEPGRGATRNRVVALYLGDHAYVTFVDQQMTLAFNHGEREGVAGGTGHAPTENGRGGQPDKRRGAFRTIVEVAIYKERALHDSLWS